jgi:hypothetical protein
LKKLAAAMMKLLTLMIHSALDLALVRFMLLTSDDVALGVRDDDVRRDLFV